MDQYTEPIRDVTTTFYLSFLIIWENSLKKQDHKECLFYCTTKVFFCVRKCQFKIMRLDGFKSISRTECFFMIIVQSSPVETSFVFFSFCLSNCLILNKFRINLKCKTCFTGGINHRWLFVTDDESSASYIARIVLNLSSVPLRGGIYILNDCVDAYENYYS